MIKSLQNVPIRDRPASVVRSGSVTTNSAHLLALCKWQGKNCYEMQRLGEPCRSNNKLRKTAMDAFVVMRFTYHVQCRTGEPGRARTQL